MAGIAVTFDSTSLQTANVLTTSIQHEQLADKNVPSFKLARADGMKITDVRLGAKNITIEGRVEGTSIADLESRLDALRLGLSGTDKNLDVAYNGSTRRYVATLTNLVITRGGTATTFAIFSAQFMGTDGVGKDTSSTTLLAATVLTTTNVNTAVTVGGTAPEQQPIITLVLNSGTGLGANTAITIKNNATGQGVTITRTWAASDSLVIDCQAHTVKVNGTSVVYVGAFPVFAPGAGNINYADTFTTRNATLSATYVKRYL